jgi:hypothetical protein
MVERVNPFCATVNTTNTSAIAIVKDVGITHK